MFDLPLPNQSGPRPMGPVPNGPTVAPDPSLSFALTRMHRTPAALMSGTAAPVVVERFATLADAMQGAFELAEDNGSDAAPQLLAILDCDQRLVLAGAASHGAVAWCQPVANALEARAVVTEAVQLRAQAGRATDWHEPELVQRLRHRADLLDARLVDPLWRAFAARALQNAA
ncbi:DNA repair protein RadC [Aquicoccus porphyridii]|uniref:DNA repair protein RadC n=1 Tax=Aquicoccus porphyridii TaxID=1852029 RepID=A0A5A9YXH2_9RHOB|nr:DNA repair protein RadC [Aquicoccus porphyridii]KAA0909556.1 DNA repair protein RadC [Aquicoccus porphyridii]RAI51871.1 DNA repair protein RadC [Rhodobacteraceae bacterium AsT-22]